ncbi:MAG: TlpA family protein disulfide reductase [Bacteroidetes bacterium]|nr:MAG: TlpA family protein disulfide reductase [Bacteroidota bacterium]
MAKLLSIFIGVNIFFLTAQLTFADDKNQLTVINFDEFEPWLYKETDSIYIINFWATWCAPCVKEIPYFEKLYENYNDQKVKVLFVSLDFPAQIESRVIPFIQRMNMQAQVILLDDTRANRWIPRVDENWTGAIPATLVYNNEFRQFYQREFNYEELEEIIIPLLK